MFQEIGTKIKGVAKVIFAIDLIGSIILAVALFIIAGQMGRSGGYLVPLGIGVLILGIVTSFLGAYLLYGYGELVETTNEMAKSVWRIEDKIMTDAQSSK